MNKILVIAVFIIVIGVSIAVFLVQKPGIFPPQQRQPGREKQVKSNKSTGVNESTLEEVKGQIKEHQSLEENASEET